MKDLPPVDRYRLMIQAVVPRPIAWTLSRNESGNYNLAPFSYFNALHSDPPLIMMSVGNKRDGSVKDTRRNIERDKKYVVHIASASLANLVTRSANPLPEGESEVEDCQLDLADDWNFELPRVKQARIALGCVLERVMEIGKNKQGILFGEIEKVYVDDSICKTVNNQLLIDAMALDPLGRLGGDDYAKMGKVVTVERPPYTPN